MEHPNWIKILSDGRYGLYLDNLLLSHFTDCPQKFEYRHVENIIRKDKGDIGANAWIGIWWASTLEDFYQTLANYQHNLPDSVEPTEEGIMVSAAYAWAKENMATSKPDCFKERFPAVYDKFRGEEGAAQMAVDYWRYYGELDTRDWTVIATELAFGIEGEVIIGEDAECVLFWCGKPDLLVYERSIDNLSPVDHKSTGYLKSNWIHKWKPHSQLTGYIVATNNLCKSLGFQRHQVDRVIVNGASQMVVQHPRKNPDKPRPRFLRARPDWNPEELTRWKANTFNRAKRLLGSHLSGVWDWNEPFMCHVYDGCKYRRICDQPPGYSTEVVKRSDYIQIEPWVPYQRQTETEEEEVA
jgi:hypothetical protein